MASERKTVTFYADEFDAVTGSIRILAKQFGAVKLRGAPEFAKSLCGILDCLQPVPTGIGAEGGRVEFYTTTEQDICDEYMTELHWQRGGKGGTVGVVDDMPEDVWAAMCRALGVPDGQ